MAEWLKLLLACGLRYGADSTYGNCTDRARQQATTTQPIRLHAAQSDLHDIVPANVLGIPNAWINRRNEQALPGGTPTMEFRDLAGLADAIT